MKQTRVPAQITTVEDKIAGNLSFTQILLFLAALFCAMAIYLLAPKPLEFTPYKIPLMILSSMIFLFLAIRIRGKVILTWLFLITTFMVRPRYYVFNKNDIYGREPILEEITKKVKSHVPKPEKSEIKQKNISLIDRIALERLTINPNQDLRLIFGKKGGIRGIVSENK